MRSILFMAAAAVLGLAVPSAAAVAQASAEEAGARTAQASALVRLINPPATMLEMNLRGWEAGIGRVVTLDPTLVKLEVEYPGISKAAIDAARPLAREYCEQFVRTGGARKAAIIAERMTEAEISELEQFFETPVGRRLVAQMLGSMDVSSLARDLATEGAKTGKASVSAEELQKIGMDAVRTALQDVSAADQIALIRFGQTPAAAKFKAVTAEAERVLLEMANNPDPVFISKQQEAMTEAVLAFVDRSGKKPK